MRSLPAEKIRESVSLKLNGFSDRETARRSGISHTGVASSFRGFIERAEEVGLMRASVEYGVSDQVRELLEIAQLRRQSELTLDQAKKGFNWSRMLIDLGLAEDQIEEFSYEVLKECGDQKMPPATIVSVCRSMAATKQKTGKSYEEIEREFRTLSDSKSKLETDLAILVKRIDEVGTNHKDLLNKAHVEEKAIAQFVDLKGRLESRGCYIEDADKLDNLLSNAEKLNYDVEGMISTYELNGNLGYENSELSRVNERLVNENTRLKDVNQILDEERKKKEEMLGKVEDVEQAGLTVGGLSKIGHIIIRISAKHGIAKSEAVDLFVKEIEERYDEELGLETSINRLQATKQKLQNENRQLSEGNRIQEEHIGDRKEEIAATNWLNRNGVTGQEIINFKREFQENKKGLPELQGEFYELSKIPETLKKYDERFKQLDKEEHEKQARNKQLAKLGERLEVDNKALEEGLYRRVEAIKELMVKSLQNAAIQVESVSAEVGQRAEKAIDYSASKIEKQMDEVGKTLSQSEASLRKTVEIATRDVESINTKAFGAGRAVGGYEMLSSVHKILRGEAVDRFTGATSLLTTLRTFENYLNKQGAVNSVQGIKNLQETVKNELILRS